MDTSMVATTNNVQIQDNHGYLHGKLVTHCSGILVASMWY